MAFETTRLSDAWRNILGKQNAPAYDPQKAWQERMGVYNQARDQISRDYAEAISSSQGKWGQRQADVRGDAAQREAQAMSQLARVGMANSSLGIGTSLGEGFSRYMNAELNRIEEASQNQTAQLQMSRAGALANLAGMNLQSADQYNMANLQAAMNQQSNAAQTRAGSMDTLFRASGQYMDTSRRYLGFG